METHENSLSLIKTHRNSWRLMEFQWVLCRLMHSSGSEHSGLKVTAWLILTSLTPHGWAASRLSILAHLAKIAWILYTYFCIFESNTLAQCLKSTQKGNIGPKMNFKSGKNGFDLWFGHIVAYHLPISQLYKCCLGWEMIWFVTEVYLVNCKKSNFSA